MRVWQAELLLAAVIAARSVSYLFEKIGLESMQGTAVYACVRILAEAIAGLHCAENCNK